MAAAEAALRGAVAYEEAVAANEAAKPRSEPWPPDARIAPPGYTPPNPLAQHSRPQVPSAFPVEVYIYGHLRQITGALSSQDTSP